MSGEFVVGVVKKNLRLCLCVCAFCVEKKAIRVI